MYVDPVVLPAFLAGVALGFILNYVLRWIVNVRFRLARWVSQNRAVHGGR